MNKYLLPVLALAMVAAACGDGSSAGNSDAGTPATTAPTVTTASTADDDMIADSPATISGSAQDSDGSTIVASVALPAPGFIVVHADNNGSPGAVIGHSALLPAGDSNDVVIDLDTPLSDSGPVWPMAHVDGNENGEYDFSPPDVVDDGPAFTADGDVAVGPVEVTIMMMEAATAPATVSGATQSSDGTSVVASTSLPGPGFIVIHADNDGAPGAVIGHSALLPAGESVDVVITLDTPLGESGVVWPMAHVDGNANGEYDFSPPDVVADGPAFTADGDVAVGPIEVTVQ